MKKYKMWLKTEMKKNKKIKKIVYIALLKQQSG
jgi:hypothetical protein